MPLTRSKKTLAIIQEEEGKQAIATPEPSAATLTEDEIRASKDPNRLLLLNILENQKTSDHMHEKRFKNLNTLIQASKNMLEAHIAENNKVIDSIKTDVDSNKREIKGFQDDANKLKADLASLQAKYDTVSTYFTAHTPYILHQKHPHNLTSHFTPTLHQQHLHS